MASEDITGNGDRVVSSDPHSAPRLHQQKILQACKQYADIYLEGLFKQVIDKLDDVLFDRSNKGGADSNAYIEAARELRLKRQDIARSFLDKFTQSYKSRLNDAASAASAGAKEKAQGCGLSLVDEQDLEESLAVDGLVVKANDRFRNELYALAQRFNLLVNGAQYNEDMQPLGSEAIGYSFRDVFQEMEWKVEIKLIAYKLFEKNVMETLGDFYHQINAILSKAGILQELKLGISSHSSGGAAQGRSPRARENGTPASAASQGLSHDGTQGEMQGGMQGGSVAVDVYQTLQQLMNVRKYGADSSDGLVRGMSGGSGGGDIAGSGMVMEPSLPADDLVRGLSLLQHNPLPIDSGDSINVAIIKNALLEQMRQIGDRRGLHPAHDNTIDVIGMIFEFILDEPSIPDMVKNLLNRLQIPILKVALVDKAFFTNKSHPARRLLNVLGHASIGWNDNDEEARERRFQKMEDVVSRVLADFEQDPGIFAALLEEFTEFLAKEGAEVGGEQLISLNDRIQDESSDRLAFEAIESRLEGAEVPEVLREFLRNTWRNVLQYALDQEGHESDGWCRHERTVDDLMWSVEPKTTADERRKMVASLPRLLNSLREGMTLIGNVQQEMDDVIDALEPIHMACLRGEKPIVEESEAEQPEKAADAADVSSSNVVDMIRSIQEGMLQSDDRLTIESGEAMNGNAIDIDREMMPSFASYQEDVARGDENIEDDFTAVALEMKIGTWLEFTMDDKKRRAKLAWKSAVMGEYVFVDRKYKVVAEKTLAELADDLRRRRAEPVENVAMFDRALDKVLNGLMTSGGAAN